MWQWPHQRSGLLVRRASVLDRVGLGGRPDGRPRPRALPNENGRREFGRVGGADGSTAEGDVLSIIATDKVASEVLAPSSGALRRRATGGENYDVGYVFAEVE
jgi:hypothetical protein